MLVQKTFSRRVQNVVLSAFFGTALSLGLGQGRADAASPFHAFVYRETDDLLAAGSLQAEKSTRSKKSGISKNSSSLKKNASAKINWVGFDDSLFARAKRENKFVLLDLEAVWCHWCHVMDRETYTDPEVVKLINERYIAVKVDQDARPDLSHKYEDYGWPATIIFNADGKEIVKRSGYIRAERMRSLLEAIIKDPTPEEKEPPRVTYSRKGALSDELKKELIEKHLKGYDSVYGAWGRFHKFLDWDSVEYAMETGLAGDKEAEARARKTLDGQLNLLDPVWGGVYQYSTDGDWKHPHFEKIMQMQAENMRIYSLGYRLYKDERYLKAASEIARYLNQFLSSPDGAFYTSQDADLIQGKHSAGFFELDDAARRARGIPKIDKHSYARENGWAITGYAALYAASGEKRYLDRALAATAWVEKNRALAGGESGGFSHDARDAAGPYLGDTLAMGRAYLALYGVTGDRVWLGKARTAADFIEKHFTAAAAEGDAGYVTADLSSSKIAAPVRLPDENARLCRFANLLYHYSGKPEYKAMAERAMRFIATAEIARRRKILVAGPLLADLELSRDPLHVTVVGKKGDAAAEALFKAAIAGPAVYSRIEFYDRAEGVLPNSDVEYPDLGKAAVFSCGDGICSAPVYEASQVKRFFEPRNTNQQE